MILVTGATGNAGSQVVQALRDRGGSVRAFVRDPGKARDLFGEGVELAIGDFADPNSVRAALEGVNGLLLSCSDDPRRVEWETNAIDAAAAAGVERIVRLSTIGAEPGAPVAFWDWHGRVDAHLRQSGAAVVLQSSFYMSNLFAAAEPVANEGKLYAPAGEARIAMIDPSDVGAVASAVLTTAGHGGRTYVLTGPDTITYAQAASALSAAIGRRVDFVDVPGEGFKQGLAEAGMPTFVAEQLAKIFEQLRQGVATQVTDAVESLTGRRPRDFTSFARVHAPVFEPAGSAAATLEDSLFG
jgi:uncharacterized protein YbjT (DUF2867 family)